MRNDIGRDKPERPSGSSRKSSDRRPGTAGRKPPRGTSPQHTGAQRETMQAGLRVLARIIARAHLKRQAARRGSRTSGPSSDDEPRE